MTTLIMTKINFELHLLVAMGMIDSEYRIYNLSNLLFSVSLIFYPLEYKFKTYPFEKLLP